MGISLSKSVALLLVLVFLTASFLTAILPVRAAANSWVLRASMPEPQVHPKVAVVNGKIYVFGCGVYNGTLFNTNEVYDPATDKWAFKAPMRTPRRGFAVAAYENKIYVIGGQDPFRLDLFFNVTEVYDPATDTWTAKAQMPKNESYMGANVVNGKIYVTSGMNGYPYAFKETEVYDPSTDLWASATPMPIPVSDYASAVVDDKIYVLGGFPRANPVNAINATQIYDTATDTWTMGAPLPVAVPVGGHPLVGAGATTGVMAPKRIYVLGGCASLEGDFVYGLNQVYDPENNSWSTGAKMPINRDDYRLVAVAVLNDILYVIVGGAYVLNGGLPLDWVYSPVVVYTFNMQYTPLGYGGAPIPSPSPSPSPPPRPLTRLLTLCQSLSQRY